MNCPICGADTGAATAFCPNCGSRLEAPISGADSSPFSSPAAPPSAFTPPPAAPPSITPPPIAPPPAAPGSSYGSPYSAAADNVTRPAVNVAPPPAGAPYPPLNNAGGSTVVSVKSWLGTLLIMLLVPLALTLLAVLLGTLLESVLISTLLGLLASLSGLIMVFIFAFSKKVNPSKRNFFKATLILALIMIGLGIIFGVLITVFGATLIDSLDWQSLFSGLEGLGDLDPSMFDPSMFDI